MITMKEADFERFNAIECYAMDEEHTFEECAEYAASLGVIFTSADMQRIVWDMDEAWASSNPSGLPVQVRYWWALSETQKRKQKKENKYENLQGDRL